MNRIKDVSVILPYVRPEGAERCLAALKELYPQVEIMAEFDPDKIGPAKMIDKLQKKTTRSIVWFLADDTVPLPGCLEAALNAMDTLPDGWGMVGFNTGEGNEKAPHWLAHKNLLPLLDGEFHHTGYKHCYGSDEFTDRCQEMGRYAKAWDAVIEHNNPALSGGDVSGDPVLNAVYGENGNKQEDFLYYARRKRQRLNKLAIGFPLVDDSVPVQFFTSFACLEKPSEYTLLVPEFPHGPWASNIADARNSLMIQALEAGASRLLMCDTDQVYPPDTLTKLMAHDVDVCGVRVHSRWPPYAPVFYRGTLGRYEFIPDEEMYSGGLVEIDATGTGCILINMDVCDKVEPPWFQFTTFRDRPVGEDIYFSSKIREAGLKIAVDTSIEVGHLTTIAINRIFHAAYKQMENKRLIATNNN
jgi:hypothetical protein